jgi:hypothetical protein
MQGIDKTKWEAMPQEVKDAMRRNMAETFSRPVDQVGWRQAKRRGVVRMFLYLMPRKDERPSS